MKPEEMTKILTDGGKIIEAGWLGLVTMVIPKNAPQDQLDDMRMAFFAGAHHLFSSIMCVLDPGEKTTERDLKRINLIQEELCAFLVDLKSKELG